MKAIRVAFKPGDADMTKLARAISNPLSITILALAWAVGSAGCGEDSANSGPPDLTPFVGTWSVAAAGLTISCTDHSVQAITVNAPTVFVAGTASDLVDSDATCPVAYDVSSHIAHALPGQICDHPDVITRMHLLEDTFTIGDDGMATHQASGKLDGFINITLGETVECNFTEMGIYRRAGS
jgi:hypothetical protein